MRLKPKRRLILLTAVVIVLALGAFAGLFVRRWQRDRMTNQLLAEGLAAYKAGDYYNALGKTGSFITRVGADPRRARDPKFPDALLAYADSRRLIEEPDGHNYRDCLKFYQEYHVRRPGDRDAAATLLRMYNICGMGVEAYKLADELLPADGKFTEKDLPVLRDKALGQLTAKAFDDVPGTVAAITAIAPLDLPGNAILLANFERQGKRAKARAHADKLLDSDKNNPAALLIAAISRQIDPTPDDSREAAKWVRQAVGLDPDTGARVSTANYPDADFVTRALEVMDRLRLFDDSLLVLREATAKFDDPDLLRSLVRRLWQERALAEVVQRTNTLDVNSRTSDPDTLAFRALALLEQTKAADAAPIEAALAARSGDYRARAWALAIPLMDPARAPKEPKAIVDRWLEVLKISPNEPVYQASLAEVYAGLGRTDEARQLWEKASGYLYAASWVLPPYRIAQTLMADGRAEHAARWAATAMEVGQHRLPVTLLWVEAQAAAIQKGVPAAFDMTAQGMLDQLNTIDEQLAKAKPDAESLRPVRERLLVPRVIFLARAGQREEARKTALAALDQSPPLQPTTIQRLASASQSERLGIEEQCVAHLASGAGADTALYARAVQQSDAGDPDGAVALLRDAAAKNPGDLNAQAAVPRLLERLESKDATAAWAQFGNAHPDSLPVQRLCLESGSAPLDKAFLDATIARYRKLTGLDEQTDDTPITIAKARNLLSGNPGRTDRDAAISKLTVLINRHPAEPLTDAKLLLAAALSLNSGDLTPDYPRAAGLLKETLASEPRNHRIALQLAGVLQAQGDFAQARAYLTRVAADPSAELRSRRDAAERLIAQGDINETVADRLAGIVKEMGRRAPAKTLVLLGEAYVSLRNAAAADEYYGRLAAGAADDRDSIYMTARHFALAGDQARVDAALALLDAIKSTPADKEFVLARLAADRRDSAAARQHFEAAVAADPKRTEFWTQYAAAAFQESPQAAAAVAARAAKANPGDAALAALSGQTQSLAKGGLGADLSSLIASLGADPKAAEALKSLQDLQDGYAKGQYENPEQLIRLADRFPAFPAVQFYAAARLAGSNPDAAAVIAERTMAARPADPMAAQRATELYFQLGRWAPMLNAAAEWRKRDISRSARPDLAIARAQLQLGQVQKGLDTLKPRLDQAVRDPDGPDAAEVLNLQARLLLAAGREPDARALLEPLLPRSARIRNAVWLGIVADGFADVDQSLAWLDRLTPYIPKSDAEAQMAVGMTLYGLGERLAGMLAAAHSQDKVAKDKIDELFQRALAVFTEFTRTPATATAAAFEAVGIVRFRTGDTTGAEEAFKKSVSLDPERAASLNNLAFIALQTHGDPAAAIELAKRAVAADDSASNLDTLASAYNALAERQAASQPEQARASYRAAAEQFARKARAGMLPAALGEAAVAYENAGDLDAAIGAYQTALSSRTLKPEHAANMKNNLAIDLVRAKRRDDYDHAMVLISEAIAFRDLSAFEDTRAQIFIAQGRFKEASDAFGRAITLYNSEREGKGNVAADLPSSVVGRAWVLAKKLSPLDREEVRRLVDQIEPDRLQSQEDRDRYNEARAALQ